MRILWFIVAVLLCIVGVFGYLLFAPVPRQLAAPTPAPVQPAAPTTTAPVAPAPLHTHVVVSSPAANSTVGNTFEVNGEAPGNWYFEASFPIQVRDKDNGKIAQGIAQAQSDWMTTEQVPFKATVTLDSFYTGPATLVLLRDNPSGLPENEDSLEIPILIQ